MESFITNGKLEHLDQCTYRLKIPRGWIVITYETKGMDAGGYAAQTLVKDPDHLWEIEK